MAAGGQATEALEQLYGFAETLANAKDKSQHDKDFRGIIPASRGTKKEKELAAQLIPRFFKFFPQLSAEAINALLDLCEDDELAIRIQAVRALPFLCKDTPEHLPKIADVLGQLLVAEDAQEQLIVQNSLMQVVRQDPKDALTATFKHIESADDNVREKVIAFIRTKVIPNRSSLLSPQKEMERHVTNLIKGLHDVSGEEFAMFMSFLQELSIFRESPPKPERMQELVEIAEGQADLNAKYEAGDADHMERVLACIRMALPFFAGGGSNSRFLGFISKHLLPAFDQLAEDKQAELLRSLAESAPYTGPADARLLLPAVLVLAKKYMPKKKEKELNLQEIECVLFTFQQLAFKVPNATNALCGYKIVTGQPSDRLGEDFSEEFQDWVARLKVVEEEVKRRKAAAMQTNSQLIKEERSAADDAAKASIKEKKEASMQLLRVCTNIEKLVKGLHATTPSFLGAAAPAVSWKAPSPEVKAAAEITPKPNAAATGRGKRLEPASNVAPAVPGGKRAKQDPGGNQMVSRAFQGLGGSGKQAGRGGRKGGSGVVGGVGGRAQGGNGVHAGRGGRNLRRNQN